jgi:putative transcriptional regulator
VARHDGRGARKRDSLAAELRLAFGQHCREARIKRDLSQQEVATLSGRSQADIAKIENGQQNITLETMMRILRVVDREGARRVRGDLKARLGRSMRAARAEAGLSQAQVAERAGVRTQYIALIETGTANVKLETVATMAGAVGQDPNRLLGGVFNRRTPGGGPPGRS